MLAKEAIVSFKSRILAVQKPEKDFSLNIEKANFRIQKSGADI